MRPSESSFITGLNKSASFAWAAISTAGKGTSIQPHVIELAVEMAGPPAARIDRAAASGGDVESHRALFCNLPVEVEAVVWVLRHKSEMMPLTIEGADVQVSVSMSEPFP